jgi:hypothetical protein
MTTTRFDSRDLEDELPLPGFYEAHVTAARYGESAGGNPMVQVTYVLEGAAAASPPLCEYFVVGGASPRAVAVCRRRLVDLYRSAGIEPTAGQEIVPSDLLGAELEIQLEQEWFRGRPRLKVAAHRPRGSSSARVLR